MPWSGQTNSEPATPTRTRAEPSRRLGAGVSSREVRLELGGLRWRFLRLAPSRVGLVNGEPAWGWCDSRTTSRRAIAVDKSLVDEKELEVITHECLHAMFPFLSEEVVTQSGAELSAALWKLGYRKQ